LRDEPAAIDQLLALLPVAWQEPLRKLQQTS
jgi:hypothetical protein